MFILLLSIFYRLFHIQIVQQQYYNNQATKNKTQPVAIENERGSIFDRNGDPLATYKAHVSLEVDDQNSLNQLAVILNQASLCELTLPCTIQDLTTPELQTFYEHKNQLDKIKIIEKNIRYYHDDEAFSHIIGFVKDHNQTVNLDSSRKIGASGIEQFYDYILTARPTIKTYEVNSKGKRQALLDTQTGENGSNIILTLDGRLQKKAYDLLKSYKGALVALNPQNGEILALVSTPSFSNNKLSRDGHNKNNGRKSQLNRAINGLYPPASTIKPFIALFALKHKFIDQEYSIHDPGFYMAGNRVFNDWYKEGQGEVNLNRAIAVSSDTYFYHIGEKIGINGINKALKDFFFGTAPELDIYQASEGLVPSPEWKLTHQGERWYTGDTIITAIGQGALLASPLQLAVAAALIGNHGHTQQPHFLLSLQGDSETPSFDTISVSEYSGQDYETIIQAMVGAVNGPEKNRTARSLNNDDFDIAAKTGTAQVISIENSINNNQSAFKDHSLLIGFLPHKKPTLAFALIVENQPGMANSIARRWLTYYSSLYDSKNMD